MQHVGLRKHRCRKQQRSEEARLRSEEVIACAVNPGERQQTAEERQRARGHFTPAGQAPPDGKQQGPAQHYQVTNTFLFEHAQPFTGAQQEQQEHDAGEQKVPGRSGWLATPPTAPAEDKKWQGQGEGEQRAEWPPDFEQAVAQIT